MSETKEETKETGTTKLPRKKKESKGCVCSNSSNEEVVTELKGLREDIQEIKEALLKFRQRR